MSKFFKSPMNLVVLFAIALVAIWASNNVEQIEDLVS